MKTLTLLLGLSVAGCAIPGVNGETPSFEADESSTRMIDLTGVVELMMKGPPPCDPECMMLEEAYRTTLENSSNARDFWTVEEEALHRKTMQRDAVDVFWNGL